jgi:hypothetical protein
MDGTRKPKAIELRLSDKADGLLVGRRPSKILNKRAKVSLQKQNRR